MNKAATFALLAILTVLPGFGQSTQTDSQTLQAILMELQTMHNDVRLGTTTQILLTELQVQQTAVNRVMQRRDDLRVKLSQTQTNQKNMTTQLAQFEENASTTGDATQKKRLADVQENFKTNLVNMKSQEQQQLNDVQEAESALRKEQETLAGIQDQLNDVVKKLQPSTSR